MSHTAWRAQDGAFPGSASSITQTRDGYIWIASDSGLLRFDGIKFVKWKLPQDGEVFATLASADGALWVGTGRGVFKIQHGRVEVTDAKPSRYKTLLEDPKGGIWTVRTHVVDGSGPLCEIQGRAARCFGKPEGIDCAYSDALAQDAQGRFWLGGDKGLCIWRPGAGELLPFGTTAFKSLTGVTAIIPASDGAMLVGFHQPGRQLGLQQVIGKTFRPFRAAGLDGATLAVTALFRDRAGALWIGTEDQGLYRVAGDKVDHISRSDGLSSNQVTGFFEDKEGSVWVASTGGVDRFHDRPIAAFTEREGLLSDSVAAVLATRDGAIWTSTADGLNRLRDGKISAFTDKTGLPGHTATALFEDHAGRLWLGVDNDLAYFDGRAFHIVRTEDGGPIGAVLQIAEDAGRHIWLVAIHGQYSLFRLDQTGAAEPMPLPGGVLPHSITTTPDGGVWVDDWASDIVDMQPGRTRWISGPNQPHSIRAMLFGPDGGIVVAARTGLLHLHAGRWSLLTAASGLPCTEAESLGYDRAGALWVRLQCGVLVIDKADVEAWLRKDGGLPRFRFLGAFDGARAGVASFSPAQTRSPDGRVWFATDGPLLTLDPDRLALNPLPPPVHIEQIIADHRAYDRSSRVEIPPLSREVQINYSGLSFVAPDNMAYRYRLSGVDRDWTDAGSRRSAFYSNLPPGPHTFQVIASNNNGMWNTVGDAINIDVLPAVYQTWWFRVVALVFTIATLWFLVTLRDRYVTAEIEARLAERQAERLRIARELHDTLLQGFHGLLARFQVVANAIPDDEPARPMMDALLDRADEILVEGRDRVRDLRLTENDGSQLLASLETIAFDLERRGSAPIEVKLIGAPLPLNPDCQREITAIAKEVLTNAFLHASATSVTCVLIYTRTQFILRCSDDGVGIDPEILSAGGRPGHWGLIGTRERAAKVGARLTIAGAAPGTVVELRVKGRIAYPRGGRLKKLDPMGLADVLRRRWRHGTSRQ